MATRTIVPWDSGLLRDRNNLVRCFPTVVTNPRGGRGFNDSLVFQQPRSEEYQRLFSYASVSELQLLRILPPLRTSSGSRRIHILVSFQTCNPSRWCNAQKRCVSNCMRIHLLGLASSNRTCKRCPIACPCQTNPPTICIQPERSRGSHRPHTRPRYAPLVKSDRGLSSFTFAPVHRIAVGCACIPLLPPSP